MNDTRKMCRARAKIEYKKMQKNRSVPQGVAFHSFFDFYMKNQNIFVQAARVQAEVDRRKASVPLSVAKTATESMVSDIDDSFLIFDEDEDEAVSLDELDDEAVSDVNEALNSDGAANDA
jgi:hypothetical protein